MMKIAILGFDREGRASYDYFANQGHELFIHDRNPDVVVPEGATVVLGEHYLDNLDQYDLLVRTPGLKPRDIIAANPGVAAKVTSGTNEFFKATPTTNIIGVTGTKGKGTTSSLIAALLAATGKRVHLGGNIGTPALALLQNGVAADDWVVLELSSFQLTDLHYSPHIGVCLMIVPEHLNWHADMADYLTAKQQLFNHQSASDLAIYYAKNEHATALAAASPGQKIPYYAAPGAIVTADGTIEIANTAICHVNELQLLGKHNWQNVCAAVTAVWQVVPDVTAIQGVLRSFQGLPHRLEPLQTVREVRYYNDSFAATPDAAIAALQAIPGPLIMIVGGFDRGLNIDHFAAAIAQSRGLKKAVLIGQSAERLASRLQMAEVPAERFTISQATTMPEVVREAASYAEPGDAVVLSPGFASFDMFKNFEDRGDQFKQAVAEL